MQIHERAMLVDLSIKQWSMRKLDKDISREIENKYNAFDAGNYNKVLIAVEQGKEITRASTEARAFHYENTLAWDDNGRRILPSGNYLNYLNEMNSKKTNFLSTVNRFCQNYEYYKNEAKNRLNGLFKESDYPALSEIESRYGFEIMISPVPHKDDFRVSLGDVEMERVQREIEERVTEAQGAAVLDLWDRLHSSIKHIIDRLSDKDAVFRDSLIGNVIELTDLLPRLNFTNDRDLEAMRREVEKSICRISPDNIRNDAKLRNDTVKKANELANKMKGYMG